MLRYLMLGLCSAITIEGHRFTREEIEKPCPCKSGKKWKEYHGKELQ